MAFVTRLILRDSLLRYSPRVISVIPPTVKSEIRPVTTTVSKLAKNEDFWEKNKKLGRPTSPHLTIYKLQITSMLSITHRATGLYLSMALYGFSFAMLGSSHNFAQCMESLQAAHYGPALIVSMKFLLAWPFFYHFANGIRHLAWDMGQGFELKQLYASGYAVLGISSALAIIASLM